MNEQIKTNTVKKILALLKDGKMTAETLDIQKSLLSPNFPAYLHTKQHKFDVAYLRMAEVWATNSHAKRRKVGSIVVNNNQIISDGFNGTISGFDNCCEDQLGNTKPDVIHAEFNALAKIASSTNSSNGATVYVTLSPCVECAKLMIQSGIKRVVFGEFYKDIEGLDWLVRKEIPMTFIDLAKVSWNDITQQETWQDVFGWNQPAN